MIITILFFASLVGFNRLMAQDSIKNSNEEAGVVEIVCDERLNDLMKTRHAISKDKPVIEGYRVQVLFASGNNSKKMANDIRTQFLGKYPDVGAYIIWHAPNYKVRVGDFRTKLEAYKFYKEIKADFPSSFIVTDDINLPNLD